MPVFYFFAIDRNYSTVTHIFEVDSTAIFYSFIDLTDFGSNRDEQSTIRHSSVRSDPQDVFMLL
jgi:hypothetical protein